MCKGDREKEHTMTNATAATVQSTAEKIAAYRGRVSPDQLDALVLGATLAIWSEHSADGTQPFDVEDALRSALNEI